MLAGLAGAGDLAAQAPTVTGLSVNSPTFADKDGTNEQNTQFFWLTEVIEVSVTFSDSVDVTGTPHVVLGIGSCTTCFAEYASGTGTDTLVFTYEVLKGDTDSDGLSIAADALKLNGGTINASGGAAATLDLGTNAFTNDMTRRVMTGDTGTRNNGITGVALNSPASGSTFGNGDTIQVTVTWSRQGGPWRRAWHVWNNVVAPITIGDSVREAAHVSTLGTGFTTILRYVVQWNDMDADGVSGDRLTNTAFVPYTSSKFGHHAIRNSANHKVDGNQGPASVTGLSLNTPAESTYVPGDWIEATLEFNKAVDVTGTPQLALAMPTGTKQAEYASGSGSARLVFRYQVVSGDEDFDGISVAANALALNSGTITTAGSTTENAFLTLGSAALTDSPAHRVAASRTWPAELSFNTPVAASTYELDDTIVATVRFTRAVAVDVTGGTPQLGLGIGASTRQASYVSGTGTTSLEFRYVVQSTDTDADGISVANAALGLNGGTITTSGANAVLWLAGHSFTDDANYKTSGTRTAAAVSGLSIASDPPADETYAATDTIEAEVTFNRPVDVVTTSGTPQLALGIGANTRQAEYASGTGTKVLKFRYVVVAADADPDGITVWTGALALNGGGINDGRSSTLAASLALGTHRFSDDGNHKVNGTIAPASVSTVQITSQPASGDTYGLGERIALAVQFDRTVAVTGVPQVEVALGGTLRQARYVSGSGTDLLTFHYWVQGAGSGGAGPGGVDRATGGIAVNSGALTLNGGTIKNVADPERGFEASLDITGHEIPADADHKVDGGIEVAPVVTGVEVTSAPTGPTGYGSGGRIVLRVSFSRAVVVTGTPRLALVIGVARRQAAYVSGSGTDALEFRYRVVPSDADRDGFSVPANALELAGGAIGLAGGHGAQARPVRRNHFERPRLRARTVEVLARTHVAHLAARSVHLEQRRVPGRQSVRQHVAFVRVRRRRHAQRQRARHVLRQLERVRRVRERRRLVLVQHVHHHQRLALAPVLRRRQHLQHALRLRLRVQPAPHVPHLAPALAHLEALGAVAQRVAQVLAVRVRRAHLAQLDRAGHVLRQLEHVLAPLESWIVGARAPVHRVARHVR